MATTGIPQQIDNRAPLPPSNCSIVTVIALAIKRVEGYYPGSRSFRDDNPGNLEEQGTAGKDGVYAKFASYQDGWERLIGDITIKMHRHPDFTLLQVMDIYAPAADHNDPTQYADFIAETITKDTGIPVDSWVTMADLLAMQDKLDGQQKQVA